MAPPAGTSTMLRSRRRDATLKPNRTLDRNASRGMLYENEELRLRTININAEVEKGQNYIKKLRRENEQLKREIWNLREEYERLENYVKSREQSENEEEDDGDGETALADELVAVDGSDVTMVPLETVMEEDDGGASGEPIVDGNDAKTVVGQDSRSNEGIDINLSVDDDVTVVEPRCDVTACNATIGGRCGDLREVRVDGTVTVGILADSGGCGGGGQDPAVGQPVPPPPLPLTPPLRGVTKTPPPPPPTPLQDATMTLPHTACFDIDGCNRDRLQDLTVDEVVDAVHDAELRDKLRSVCLSEGRCYMTFADAEHLERALHTALRIRDVSILLMDTGAGAVMLSLTGVPDAVADKDVLRCLKKYGTVVGGVERRTARGGTTTGGERYARVRLTLGAPRYLWFGSDKVIVRQLTEHETGTMNSVARRKSFRSQVKLNLKIIDPPAAVTATESQAEQVTPGFRFPADPKAAAEAKVTAPPPPPPPPPPSSASASVKSAGSPKRLSRAVANERDGCPPTPGPGESPLRARRRPSVMQAVHRRDTIASRHRGGSVSRTEDADSDTSTICRRKLSISERAEKVPWCGCWGNGCL